jgi:hypothetical protein
MISPMGLIYAELVLENMLKPAVAPVKLRALADNGATLSSIPETMAIQLELDLAGASLRPIELADGSVREVPYAGPVRFRFKNRESMGGVLVMGDEALLGAVQMEDMDLVLLPQKRLIDVNPDHPNRAVVKIK